MSFLDWNKRVDEASAEFLALVQRADLLNPRFTPIEQKLGVSLLYAICHPDHFARPQWHSQMFLGLPGKTFMDFPPHDRPGFFIAPQVSVGQYIADFAVVAKVRTVAQGVIECDGHASHERTPEQATHDRARDRYMQSIGITVLRYTGREIVSNPLHSAVNALSILEQRASMA